MQKSLADIPASPAMADTLYKMGCVFAAMKEHGKALTYLKDALDMTLGMLGNREHSEVQKILMEIAEVRVEMEVEQQMEVEQHEEMKKHDLNSFAKTLEA